MTPTPQPFKLTAVPDGDSPDDAAARPPYAFEHRAPLATYEFPSGALRVSLFAHVRGLRWAQEAQKQAIATLAWLRNSESACSLSVLLMFGPLTPTPSPPRPTCTRPQPCRQLATFASCPPAPSTTSER